MQAGQGRDMGRGGDSLSSQSPDLPSLHLPALGSIYSTPLPQPHIS